MAVPQHLTMADLSGKYTMNKTLTESSAMDTILKAQGVGMLKRQVASHASPAVQLRHSKDAAGVELVEISGAAPKAEVRTLTWTEQAIESPIFGAVVTKTRRVTADELTDLFLETGWTADSLAAGLIEAEMRGDKWTLVQVWGIEDVNGERRHTRHVKCTGTKGEVVHTRFVYDYDGPL